MIPSSPQRLAVLLGALALAGCGGAAHSSSSGTAAPAPQSTTPALPGTNRPPVTIGDKNFTEQFLLGELYRQALVAQGYQAMPDRNIGPTEVTVQALASGRLDMYPEYLSTWNSSVAGDQRRFRSKHAAYNAAQRYAQAHGLALLHSTPFSDTGAIGVAVDFARRNGLHTIGDLGTVATALTLGAPPQFQQGAGGLPGLEQLYGVVPTGFKPVDIGEQYQALDSGSVQAADVNTTDGQLLSGRYAVLGDPKRLFGWGNVVPVVPLKVLAAEGPAFAATLNAVSALLTTRVMRELNADVDVYHQDFAAVAKRFLVVHGLEPANQG